MDLNDSDMSGQTHMDMLAGFNGCIGLLCICLFAFVRVLLNLISVGFK